MDARAKLIAAAGRLFGRHGFMSTSMDQLTRAFFAALENWVATESASGCLFLRAIGETGGDVPEVVDVMAEHKAMLGLLIEQIVETEVPGHHVKTWRNKSWCCSRAP